MPPAQVELVRGNGAEAVLEAANAASVTILETAGIETVALPADGPKPTPASVIARIQGQGTPSAVAGDWAQAQAEPTQAIHLVIPGHPAASRPLGRIEEAGGAGPARGETPNAGGAFPTGETIAAEPLETAGDLTGPTGHGREAVVVEFGRSSETAEPPRAEQTPAGPLAGGRLLAQAQGRVDGTFTPSTPARPAGLGPGRPAPAAWRKAAESMAARTAGEAASADTPEAETPPNPAAKPARARTTRTTKKAETSPGAEPVAAARTRTTRAAKADPDAAKPATRGAPAKADPDAAKPATKRAPAKSAANGAAAKSAPGAAAKSAHPTGGAAAGAAGEAAGETSGATGAGTGRPSYRTEAAELLAGGAARQRRRGAAESEPPAENPRRRGADRD